MENLHDHLIFDYFYPRAQARSLAFRHTSSLQAFETESEERKSTCYIPFAEEEEERGESELRKVYYVAPDLVVERNTHYCENENFVESFKEMYLEEEMGLF